MNNFDKSMRKLAKYQISEFYISYLLFYISYFSVKIFITTRAKGYSFLNQLKNQ